MYVLLCCWLAAIGAGLLKSEEILEGVARLRISNDIEYEEQNFLAIMNAAKQVIGVLAIVHHSYHSYACALDVFNINIILIITET